MKKVLLMFLILFPLKAFAIDGFIHENTRYAICDEEGNMYKIDRVRYNYYQTYFINLNTNYNYDFGNYNVYHYDDSYYKDTIQRYLWVMPIVNYNDYYDYHYEFMTRYLWENIYPDKSFYFCNEKDHILDQKESEYAEVVDRIERVMDGIDLFHDTFTQDAYEEVTYEDDLLGFYTIDNQDDINVSRTFTSITLSGPPGKYDLVFHLLDNGTGTSDMFTDGTNLLATFPKTPDYTYTMHLVIKPYIVRVNFANDNEETLCFKIKNSSGDTKDNCTNNNYIEFEAENDLYELSLLGNNCYEDYHENIDIDGDTTINIDLTLKESEEVIEDVVLEPVYINTSEDSEVLSFVAKNTFSN